MHQITKLKPKSQHYDDRPTFSLNATDFPIIEGWKVGGTYKLMVEVEQISMSKNEYGDKKNEISGRFRITGIATKEDHEDTYVAARGGEYAKNK